MRKMANSPIRRQAVRSSLLPALNWFRASDCVFRILLPAALVLVAGCSQSDTVPVTGVVLFNGQPAAEAEVMFNPKTGRLATGVTDASGRFKLATFKPDDGALPGDYVVTL